MLFVAVPFAFQLSQRMTATFSNPDKNPVQHFFFYAVGQRSVWRRTSIARLQTRRALQA